MASGDSSLLDFIGHHLGRLPAGLVYAVFECLVILLLFLEGLISFLAGEIARFFGLKVPCLFCTRLDRRPDPDLHYKDTICEAHALEVSFLAYCHAHGRLAHVSRMCKGCLLSFAVADGRTRSHTYQSLVDVLAADFEDERSAELRHREGGLCACCGEQLWMKSSYLPRLVRMLSETSGETAVATPKLIRTAVADDGEASGGEYDSMSHVLYRELKLTSDTESETAETAEEDDVWSSTAAASENDESVGPGRSLMQVGLDSYLKELGQDSGSQEPSPKPQAAFSTGGGLARLAIENGMKRIGSAESIDQTDSKAAISFRDASRSTLGSPRISATPSPRLSMLRKRLSMKKLDVGTGSASFMASTTSALPGNSEGGLTLLHRLKRQVRLDRKSLIGLCAELDKERSASAVAANQAMAMINRLQEEKAAVQMDALQYQRMMEEQAEYDQEALQAMRRLLAKRDKDVRALEVELEAYRDKYPGEEVSPVKLEWSEGDEDHEVPMGLLVDMDGGDKLSISGSNSFGGGKFESRAERGD